MWDIIINPFVTLLTLLYSLFGNNIVVAIVVFTVAIRLLTYPLLARSQESSKRMQELQPRIKKLQEKYKDDREKQQQAVMEVYKEAGVNPLGSCFPMLIQFPVFIGLYQAIYFALAASPFQLVDLSERLLIPGLDGLIPLQNTFLGMDLTQPPAPPSNPEYALVLPLLVMGTTYLQSKLTMAQRPQKPEGEKDSDSPVSQAESVTKSMTTIMPLMFGMITLSLSVGVGIYFVASNLVGIIQYSPMGKRVLDRIFMRKPYDPDAVDTSEPARPERKLSAAAAGTSGKKANAKKSSKSTKSTKKR